jgi:hypothetical protein
MQADYEETNHLLGLEIGESLGTVLLEQRRSLPDRRRYRAASEERAHRVTEARFCLYRVERELKSLGQPAQVVDESMAGSALGALGEADRNDLRSELERTLQVKKENLERLAKTLREYVQEIGAVEVVEKQLTEKIDDLAAILDEHLLWIRNSLPIGLGTFTGLGADMAWFLSPTAWSRVVGKLLEDLQGQVALYALMAGLLLGVVGLRRRTRGASRRSPAGCTR